MRKSFRRNSRRIDRSEFMRNFSCEKTEQSQENKWRKKEIIFAFLAVIISVFTLLWTVYQDFKKDKEEITINSFTPISNTNLSFSNFFRGKLITLEFGILLSNISDNTISLIDYKLEQVAEKSPESFPVQYNKMNQGFIDEDGKISSMPFIIKSGESRLVYIKTGIIIDENIYLKINDVYKQETGRNLSHVKKFTYKDLQYYTVKARIDIYGNSIEGETNQNSLGEKSFFSSIELENAVYPIFSLTFKSAKGNYFTHQYSEYKMNNF
ncbi:hypothetical protein NSS76_12910 [Bacillus sp. FSL R5-0654]|nr:hypothetical protein [Bacillus safensis]KAB3541146.1 hypothetical protein F9229_04840 [Bacillus safensis]KAB3546389.1 hypothetical protein F9231_00695 [Bacillus safensis]MCY7706297.1 hypothetical protein [Bacillus safensis]MCY7719836.1 hypothetical protein [Bacillus safensis]MED0727597.1 hypothetical protein [Bacillus safensis]